MESAKLKKKVTRRYADRRLCACKHSAADHTIVYDGTRTACSQILAVNYKTGIPWCQCFKFKLDNLAYVEQLAQERGLI